MTIESDVFEIDYQGEKERNTALFHATALISFSDDEGGIEKTAHAKCQCCSSQLDRWMAGYEGIRILLRKHYGIRDQLETLIRNEMDKQKKLKVKGDVYDAKLKPRTPYGWSDMTELGIKKLVLETVQELTQKAEEMLPPVLSVEKHKRKRSNE